MKDPKELQTQSADLLSDPSSAATLAISDGSVVGAAPSRPSIARAGQELDGRYVLESQLGEGGMGVVFLGRHKVIDKRVAIKILRADLAADAEMTDRFLTEAKAASSIGNPHIVDISDFGRLPDGTAYFVMEYLDGKSLADLMEDLGVVSVTRIVHIAKQIAKGLAAAHARGIVHRDLKPENVMLVARGDDNDFVKILDFGIAKVSTEGSRVTRAGSVFGTPHYMSPEQAAGVPVDKRTDIYALGVILYEMAAGKVPFDADNFMGILTQHMYKAPVPIRALVPQPQEVPPGLEAVVLKALSKKVELRYQSMEELVADFEKIERGIVPDAVSEMMARSGGFNVPADYFRNPQRPNPGGPAMVAASPQLAPKNNKLVGVLIGLSIFVAVIGIGLALSALRSRANAEVAPAPEVATVAAPATASATPAAPTLVVTVGADPIDAHVFKGSEDLGPQPVTVTLAQGETIALRAEAPGHASRAFDVNGVEKRVLVKLDKVAQPVAAGIGRKPALVAPTAKPTTTTPTAAPKPSATQAVPERCPGGQRDPFTKQCINL